MSSHSIALYKNLQKRYSRRINLDLERIQKVLAVLGFPQLELDQPINILGSDGKMSDAIKLFRGKNIIIHEDYRNDGTYDYDFALVSYSI